MTRAEDAGQLPHDDPARADAAQPGEDPTGSGPGSAAFLWLGSNVRKLRSAAGMTLEALARAVNGPGRRAEHSWARQIEAGRSQPGLLQASRLAGALGLGLGELAEGIYWNPVDVARSPSERRHSSKQLAGSWAC